MKIFQPIISGSFTVSGSVYLPTLDASPIPVTNVVMFGTNGQLFTTASTAIGGGGGSGFPFSGNAVITGSLLISSSLTVSGSTNLVGTLNISGSTVAVGSITAPSFTGSLLGTASYVATASYANAGFIIASTLIDYFSIASSAVAPNNLFTRSTGSYTSAVYQYTAANGANARSGQVMAVWNGGNVQYTDNSTLDIGSTAAVTCSVSIVTAQAQFNIQTNTSGWTLKATATYM